MARFVLFLFVVASGIFISQALTAQKASETDYLAQLFDGKQYVELGKMPEKNDPDQPLHGKKYAALSELPEEGKVGFARVWVQKGEPENVDPAKLTAKDFEVQKRHPHCRVVRFCVHRCTVVCVKNQFGHLLYCHPLKCNASYSNCKGVLHCHYY